MFQVSRPQLEKIFLAMKEKICFVGHTHVLEITQFNGKKVTRTGLSQGVNQLRENEHYIINVGSVGQPRDDDNRAKYVIWDRTAGKLDVRHIEYDIAKTAGRILERGFPEFNARRLW
jgi:diadenosine tetraphosphatase ApaH/serine/threonine PP2A family protein phosphatase